MKSKISRFLTTLVALFAMTTGAWAAGKVYTEAVAISELKKGDILAQGFSLTGTSNSDKVTFTANRHKDNNELQTGDHWIYRSFIEGYGDNASLIFTMAQETTCSPVCADGKDGNAWEVTEVTVPETGVYAITLVGIQYPAPAGTALNPDATRKVWTLDAMPAGNVELQVAYFPGMLVKPTSLVGGTMEIEGVTDTALPDGFEKDDAGNIYVEAGKKFTVKAVPATGYHLVGWSDDATIKDLEREFTMPADGSDFTVTATFSDEFELTFDDVNFKTNQNITVKVGDAEKTLDQDGKLSVKAGQTVTLTAKQGYKFRSVEAKKAAAALKTLSITGPYNNETIYYIEGESWQQAITNHPTENAGWDVWGTPNKVWKGETKLQSKTGEVWNYTSPDAAISSSAEYRLTFD